MILGMMRRHAKSWLIKFIIGIITIVFIFYFGYSFRSREGLKIAYVNGEVISGGEFQKLYMERIQALQRRLGKLWNDQMIKRLNLREKILEELIDQKLFSQESMRLGLDVNESEIQHAILNYPLFQIKGQFSMARYRQLLEQNHMDPPEFEKGVAQQILKDKLSQILISLTPVTEEELKDYFYIKDREVKIEIMEIPKSRFIGDIRLDQEAIERYFKENRERYRIPEKIEVAYLELDPDEFKKGVKIAQEEIKDYYEENMDQFIEEKKVKVRHILLKVKEGASEEEKDKIRKKAERILKLAEKGEDFARLAKRYSEGPSAKQGGELGYISRGQMVKEFEDAVFSMKKGEIRGPVKTRFGYHIIKVEDIEEKRIRPIEEVREEIREILKERRAQELAYEKAVELWDHMPYEANLSDYAKESNVRYSKLNPFSKDEPISNPWISEDIKDALFSLKERHIIDVIEIDRKFYIFQVLKKIPSRIPDLKEVITKVKEDLKDMLSIESALKVAKDVLERLKGGKSWERIKDELKIESKETDFFKRGEPPSEIGYREDIIDEIFSLSRDMPYPDRPFRDKNGALIFRLLDERLPEEELFKEERTELFKSLMFSKYNLFLSEWLTSVKERADIRIVKRP